MSDLEGARTGKVGKSYPVPTNRNGNQQINYFGERFGWVIALIIGIVALIAVAFLIATIRQIGSDVDNVRGLIENSAAAASQAAVNAALAAERTDKAERSAALSREYATQVYPELNRLGYPVRTPWEKHDPIPPEAYEHHDKYTQGNQ